MSAHPQIMTVPRVLVVDDSALARQTVGDVLSAAGLTVEVAPDAITAIGKVRRRRPDAVVLDVQMPRMDGLTFLRWLMAEENPVPTVICSSVARPATRVAIEALDLGAVGVVCKPESGVQHLREDGAAQTLVDTVRAALQARLRRRAPSPEPRHPTSAVLQPGPPALAPRHGAKMLVVIGASAGGTEALRDVLKAMPRDSPPIAIVQHMPEYFTAAFARRLGEQCSLEVKEAEPGDRLVPGRALVARGGRHLAIRRDGAGWSADLLDGPPVSRSRPSVDVLFRSAAQEAGPAAVGVILTGMGDDGAQGMLELRHAGAHTIAQDEATSFVFGMPKAAIAAGAVSQILPLYRIPQAIVARAAHEELARRA